MITIGEEVLGFGDKVVGKVGHFPDNTERT